MRVFFVSFGLAYACIVAIVLATGCTPIAVKSTASVLGPDASVAMVQLERDDAAIATVGMLETLGYSFDQQHEAGPRLVIRMVRDRIVDEAPRSPRFGSAFYIIVAPRGVGASYVTIVGRPLDGYVDLCTVDLKISAYCRNLYSDPEQNTVFATYADAELIRGVLAELRRGDAGTADPAAMAQIAMRDQCRRERQNRMDRMMTHRDLKVRAKAYNALLKHFPSC